MEQRHGSLLRAMLHRQNSTAAGTSGPRYGMFVSFAQGMHTLVEHLAACLPVTTVRVRTRVQQVSWQPETARWLVQLVNQPALQADAVCLALPAPQAGQLLAGQAPELASALQAITYASSATVNMAFQRRAVTHPLHGMGFVVPAVEKRAIMACSFSSTKFVGRTPPDQVLLRAFVGGALQPEAYELADAAMQNAVYQELQQLLGLTADPLYVSISRHPQSMPQYHVGHPQRVAAIEALLGHQPGLALAGNAYHGVGIPDCIHSATNAAQALLAYLGTRPAVAVTP
jgi:oxygen-dependent protoporphyrinogen oxidase